MPDTTVIKQTGTARMYQDGFLAGLDDAYSFVVGTHYPEKYEKYSFGLLDILILPLLAQRVIKNRDSNPHVLNFFPAMIAYGIELMRHAIGIGITVLLMPVVGLVHLFVNLRVKLNLLDKIRDLEVRKLESDILQYPVKLKDLLTDAQLHANDLVVNFFYTEKDKGGVRFSKFSPLRKHDDDLTGCLLLMRWEESEQRTKPVFFIDINEANKAGIEALLATGIFKANFYLNDRKSLINLLLKNLEFRNEMARRIPTDAVSALIYQYLDIVPSRDRDECNLVKMSTPFEMSKISRLRIQSSSAYIRCGKKLIYINNAATVRREDCVVIEMSNAVLAKFDNALRPTCTPRALSKDELIEITSMTGHTRVDNSEPEEIDSPAASTSSSESSYDERSDESRRSSSPDDLSDENRRSLSP